MKSFVEHLATYAKYHRDRRNILTHLFGVPIIVFSVILLLSRPQFIWFDWELNPAMVLLPLVMLFYLRLNVAFALILGSLMAIAILVAQGIAMKSTPIWLISGIGLFVIGWVIQFIGHHYEGKKPAFVDDLVGLLIGPLFVLAEIMFHIGFYQKLQQEIVDRAGKQRE